MIEPFRVAGMFCDQGPCLGELYQVVYVWHPETLSADALTLPNCAINRALYGCATMLQQVSMQCLAKGNFIGIPVDSALTLFALVITVTIIIA